MVLPAVHYMGIMTLRLSPNGALAAAAAGSGSTSSLRHLALRSGSTSTSFASSSALRSFSTARSTSQSSKVLSKSSEPSAASLLRSALSAQNAARRSALVLDGKRWQSTAVLDGSTFASPHASSSSTSASSFSSAKSSSHSQTTSKSVAIHLFICFGLVYSIIVVGGLTRLTESGLSITEWNPGAKGMRWPQNEEEWNVEFEKYRKTPEWSHLNKNMTVDDFKSIYFWEWGHRILGRVIGVTFLVPSAFFLARGMVTPSVRWKLGAIGAGIGFQGFLGWYMVQSGLEVPKEAILDAQRRKKEAIALVPGASADAASQHNVDWTPRVSHFRLMMHLGTAFLVGLGMLHTGLTVLRDSNTVKAKGKASGMSLISGGVERLALALEQPAVRRHAKLTAAVTALVFTTALSGALVAGLDAGLVYSEFPTMGDGRLAPPASELVDDRYAFGKDEDGKPTSEGKRLVGNVARNPVTVQLMHRCLAVTTWATVVAYAFRTRSLARSKALLQPLPPTVSRLAYAAAGVATCQAGLGIATLVYLVPIPLASAHQAGAVALLSTMVALLASLRRPRLAVKAFERATASHAPKNGVGAAFATARA